MHQVFRSSKITFLPVQLHVTRVQQHIDALRAAYNRGAISKQPAILVETGVRVTDRDAASTFDIVTAALSKQQPGFDVVLLACDEYVPHSVHTHTGYEESKGAVAESEGHLERVTSAWAPSAYIVRYGYIPVLLSALEDEVRKKLAVYTALPEPPGSEAMEAALWSVMRQVWHVHQVEDRWWATVPALLS